jgi:hypothetical protein
VQAWRAKLTHLPGTNRLCKVPPMFNNHITWSGGLILLCAFLSCCVANAQSEPTSGEEIPLWKFDEMTAPGSCRMMGRFQDKEYCDSKVVDQVLALGKDAIPLLISELTDERKTRHSIYDLWKYTAAGDIANSLLFDLFTASDLTVSAMPELESLQMECHQPGESCWRKFLHKKGRKFVQVHWQAAWEAHKGQIYWDEKARCFKLMPPSSQGELVGHIATPQSTGTRQN